MRILIAGDFSQNGRSKQVFASDSAEIVSPDIQKLVSEADISVVNFEFPIIEGSVSKPISKRGPHLGGDLNSIKQLRKLGFNLCTLANNHILDQGEDCCLNTKKLLEANGIATVGVGQNIQTAAEPLIVKIKNENVAFINCCEHEFSIATDVTSGANPINPIQQYYAIQKLRKNVDYIVVIVHGGIEHYQLPTPRMKETYRFFIDAGADAVINHHQHCFSGYEIYKEKPIFYGLGNFLFDWEGKRHSIWNEGYFVILTLDKCGIEYTLYPYTQCDENVQVKSMEDAQLKKFNGEVAELNKIILDDYKLSECHRKRMSQESAVYRGLLQPYSGRIARGLFNRGLLPSLVSEDQRLGFINYLECESHFERLLYTLKTMKL